MSPTRRAERPSDAPSAALAASAVALMHARNLDAADEDRVDHWPLGGPLSGSAESWERLARTAERRVWAAQDAVEAAFAREVAAYTRVLRDAGLRPRQVLAAVAAVVRAAAVPPLGRDRLDGDRLDGDRLDGDRLDATIHDAGRYCVEAYFAR
jgi:hypothetical protein